MAKELISTGHPFPTYPIIGRILNGTALMSYWAIHLEGIRSWNLAREYKKGTDLDFPFLENN